MSMLRSALVRFLLVALVAAAALVPATADAWGPYDGSYLLNLNFNGQAWQSYMVVVQDSSNIGVVFLAQACSPCVPPSWNYGQGTPTGAPGQFQGSFLAANGVVLGSFDLTFSGDNVTGSTNTSGSVTQLTGSRFWGGNPGL